MSQRRLFYALWPDDCVRRELAAWQRQHLPKSVRATHVSDLHLTLHFLGQVGEEQLDALCALGEQLTLPPFDLVLDKLGHWPRPAVLWVGPQKPSESLTAFHARLEDALESLGFERERRTFAPHVTLARKIRRPLAGAEFPPLTWQVHEWALVESRPGERPLYHPLARWHAVSKITPEP